MNGNSDFSRTIKEMPPPQWMLDQIAQDLEAFNKSGISAQGLNQMMQQEMENRSPWMLVRFKIQNNQVDATHHPSSHPSAFPRAILLASAIKKLAQEIELPDVDFIVTTHDALDTQELPAPIFAFAKNPKCAPMIILIPDFEALRGREGLIREVHEANAKHPWSEKWNKAVWRGSRYGGIYTPENFLEFPRSKAMTLALKFPELIDAAYIAPCEEKDLQREVYPLYFGNSLSIQDQIKYKYQLLIDGNSCAYSGSFWRLFSNCVILKQSSDSIQWYYRAIRPHVHFVPVNFDMSNLPEVIQWAMAKDAEAKRISEQAQAFANENLTDFRIMQYLYCLLLEYAKLPRFK